MEVGIWLSTSVLCEFMRLFAHGVVFTIPNVLYNHLKQEHKKTLAKATLQPIITVYETKISLQYAWKKKH